MKKISRDTAGHYLWQEVCDGWHLVDRDDMSVIAEKMPPNTSEDMHFHRKACQFFYILSGEALMRFFDHAVVLKTGDGIEISPGEAHQMCNRSGTEVEFLTLSVPKSHGDKILVNSGIPGKAE